jgi:hypothetical protein
MIRFQRIAESVAIYRTLRTLVRPPAMVPLAAHLAGVAIDRRNADESSETAAVELAEFGQIGNQRVRGDIANARNRCQQVIGSPPNG